MKLTTFTIGQRFFQASLYKHGHDIDNGTGDCFTTRQEAEQDGQTMVAWHDPEWQKRHPNAITHVVRECEVMSVDEDGSLGGYRTID